MSQDYTLRLNIRADGSQAIAEANRVNRAFQQASGSAIAPGAPNAPGGSVPSPGSAIAPPASIGMASRSMSALGTAARVVSGSIGVLKTALNGAWTLLKGFVSFIAAPFKLAWSGLKTALKGVLAVVGSIAAGAFAAKKVLDPAGRMESYQVQMDVLLKSPVASRRRLAELSRYAKETNFSPEEVIGAGKQLQSFGMYDFRTLRLAGDAANAFGKSLDEVVHSLSYLKAGRTGEALESLGRFGITRDKLRGEGIRFGKGGNMLSSPEAALKAVLNVFEKEYGGMTKRIGKTWSGAIQQLGGEIFDAMSRGMQKALKPATAFVTGSLIPAIEKFGNFLQAVDWGRLLAGPLSTGSALLSAVGNFADPRTRQVGKAQLMDLWNGFKSVGEALLDGAGKIFSGFLESFGRTLGNFVSSNGMGALFNAGLTTLQAVIQAGCATFKTVVGSFSPELQMTVESILEKIPGLGYNGSLSSKFRANYDKEMVSLVQGGNFLPQWASEGLKEEMRSWLTDMYSQPGQAAYGSVASYRDTIGQGKDFSMLSADQRMGFWNAVKDRFEKQFLGQLRSEWISSEGDGIRKRNDALIQDEWASAAEKSRAAFSAVGDLASTFASSVTVQPLLEAAAGAKKGVADAWKTGVSPAVERVNAWQNMQANGGRWDYRGVSAFFGKDTADAWAEPALALMKDEKERVAAHRAKVKNGEADPEWKDWSSRESSRERWSGVYEEQRKILQEAASRRDGLAGSMSGRSSGTDADKTAKTQSNILAEVQTIVNELRNVDILKIEG